MLTHYLTLNLKPGAGDAEIREKYLELVKVFTPEKTPEAFTKINKAYEAIKSERDRIKSRLFIGNEIYDWESALKNLAGTVRIERKNATLKELIEAEGRLGGGRS